jgi:hypothetical protein
MGKNITPKEFKNSQCQLKWNTFRKSYSALIGKPYNIKPNYNHKTGGKSRKNAIQNYTEN